MRATRDPGPDEASRIADQRRAVAAWLEVPEERLMTVSSRALVTILAHRDGLPVVPEGVERD